LKQPEVNIEVGTRRPRCAPQNKDMDHVCCGSLADICAQDSYNEAKKDGWIVISMKNDWKRIFGFDSAP
jgi:hypothetical protein